MHDTPSLYPLRPESQASSAPTPLFGKDDTFVQQLRLAAQAHRAGRLEEAITAYLRLLANPNDDAAFLRVVNLPRREIGATTLERLGELAGARHTSLLQAAQDHAVLGRLAGRAAAALVGFTNLVRELAAKSRTMPAADLVDELVRRIGYAEHIATQVKEPVLRERRLENLKELGGWFRAMQKEGAAGDLAAQLALLAHGDRDDPGNAVRLMTLHSAKGLEFRFVFLIGVDDATLPHAGSVEEGRIDEERRLLYVGITRAKELLSLSYAKRRKRFGEIIVNEPSRFLGEMPSADLHWAGRDREQDAEHRKDVALSSLARLAALLGD